MRYLNKIVFINSAKTPYAEIQLDGNVHLIGTQGVGKSTLLRAILFFYNGDKTKLGIEPGRQPFDSYYFPWDNSYIVYEVARETGPYCVVALKAGAGKTVFRFINGAYNQAHFINAAGEALLWEGVRKNLDQLGMASRKIDKYSDYRDILYGNTASLPADVRNYALLQSRQYHNIPRTIQNVFLNSKLDAKFIKQTIIKSLNEEEAFIDLNRYAQQLRGFEEELGDLLKWASTPAGNAAPVRKGADGIAATANTLRQNSTAGNTLHIQIAAAWDAVLAAQPKGERALAVEGEKVEGARRRWAEYASRSQAAKQAQLSAGAVFAGKLKEAKEKEEAYAQQNIAAVLLRAGEKSALLESQKALGEELDLLSKTYTSVAAKYREQIAQAEAQLQRFGERSEKEQLEADNRLLQERAAIGENYNSLLAGAAAAQAPRRQEATEALETAREALRNRESEKREARTRRFGEAEREALRAQQTAGREAEKELSTTLKITALEMAQVAQESGQAIAQTEREIAAEHQSLVAGIETLNAAIAQTQTLLAGGESSFYNWLCAGVPGWEATIGKVVDEQSVLFRSDLSPALVPHATPDFYGVSIDLEAIAKTVKTTQDYEAEVAALHKQRTAKEAAIAGLNGLKAERVAATRKKFLPRLSALKEAEKKARYEAEQLAGRLARLLLEQQDLERAVAAEKEQALAAAEVGLSSAREALEAARKDLQEVTQKALEESAGLQKARDKKLKEAAQKAAAAHALVAASLRRQEGETAAKVKHLKAQESGALQSAGADAKRIAAVAASLEGIGVQLAQIAGEAPLVWEYNKDKRELLDQVPVFVAGKKRAEEAAQHEDAKLVRRQAAYREETAAGNAAIEVLKARCRALAEDLEAAAKFVIQSPGFDKAHYPAGKEAAPAGRLKTLCEEATRLGYERIALMAELQSGVIRFTGHFKPKNIFNFPTTFADAAAYLSFAGELEEFLAEDKIGVLEQQVNTRYAELIRLIGKETGDLISKSGEIQKVIGKINRDFKERAFAGVIKSIELQVSPATDTLVCLLQEINRFNEEHSLNTGAVNLFTSGNVEAQNQTAVNLLKAFAAAIPRYGDSQLTLASTFGLQFRIVENDNDSGWLEQLSKVGSEGTDVLVKAMINIMLLNVFKEKASGRASDFKLHCMMDEIGRLHPTNVAGILKFANDRNILLINGSPTSYNATDYKYTYLLRKDAKSHTSVVQLIKNGAHP